MILVLPASNTPGRAVACGSVRSGEKVRTRSLSDDDTVRVGNEEVEYEVANDADRSEHAGEKVVPGLALKRGADNSDRSVAAARSPDFLPDSHVVTMETAIYPSGFYTALHLPFSEDYVVALCFPPFGSFQP